MSQTKLVSIAIESLWAVAVGNKSALFQSNPISWSPDMTCQLWSACVKTAVSLYFCSSLSRLYKVPSMVAVLCLSDSLRGKQTNTNPHIHTYTKLLIRGFFWCLIDMSFNWSEHTKQAAVCCFQVQLKWIHSYFLRALQTPLARVLWRDA